MEAEARALLRDGVGEVVADVYEVSVSSFSCSPKTPMKKWIVIPSRVPVSTPGEDPSALQPK